MSKNKKKEKVVKKKEEVHCEWFVPRKKKLAVGRDLTIENFRKPEEPYVMVNYRIKAEVIDAPSHIRGPKPPEPYDALLAYLEWKLSLPWHKRLFLP